MEIFKKETKGYKFSELGEKAQETAMIMHSSLLGFESDIGYPAEPSKKGIEYLDDLGIYFTEDGGEIINGNIL
jgi:hypothetical protein